MEAKYKHHHIFKLFITEKDELSSKQGMNLKDVVDQMVDNQQILNFIHPQCNRCNDPHVKRTKRKSSTKNDFISKKKQMTLL